VVALANAMIAGYTANPADFPSADIPDLDMVSSAFASAKSAQIDAMAAAQLATETKNTKLASLEEFMMYELKKSEVDVGSDSEKLEYIGWGPKAPPTPADPPGQPRNLDPRFSGFRYAVSRLGKIRGHATNGTAVILGYFTLGNNSVQRANLHNSRLHYTIAPGSRIIIMYSALFGR